MACAELRISNRMEDLAAVVSMVEDFGAAHVIAAAVINDINLCLDELLCNIISYGYPDGGAGAITVRLRHQPGQVSVEVADDGRPFDPLQAGPPDLGGTVETRRIGGVGIHFVKELMDDVVYSRVGSENRLTLKKKLPT
jgi:serine/threonine-protein kinase RsbW